MHDLQTTQDGRATRTTGWRRSYRDDADRACIQAHPGPVKALVWFWLIDETLSANLVYQDDYEIGSTTPSDEAMAKIMTMVMAWWTNA